MSACSDREVAGQLAAYDVVALAVVDDAGRLVGAVTIDDVLDRVLPANWRVTLVASTLMARGDDLEHSTRHPGRSARTTRTRSAASPSGWRGSSEPGATWPRRRCWWSCGSR